MRRAASVGSPTASNFCVASFHVTVVSLQNAQTFANAHNARCDAFSWSTPSTLPSGLYEIPLTDRSTA